MEGVITFLNGLYNRGFGSGFIIASLLFILGLVIFPGSGSNNDPAALPADAYAKDSLEQELRSRDSSILNLSSRVDQLGNRTKAAEKKAQDLEREKQQAENQLRDSAIVMASLRTHRIALLEKNAQLEIACQSEKTAKEMAQRELKAHRLITAITILAAIILVSGALLNRRRGRVHPISAPAKETPVFSINRKVS